MITPQWEELFRGLEGLALEEHSYPYQYQDSSLIKLFVYARIEGIKGFQTLQKHLELRADVVELLGLEGVPHRKTIAERFRSLPDTVSSVLTQLTQRLIETGRRRRQYCQCGLDIAARPRQRLCTKSSGDKGELPKCGNIDQQAHWGKNGCGEWIYGYRLHSLTLCGPEEHHLACGYQCAACQP